MPGVSVAVVKDGSVLLTRGYGVVKAGEPTAVTASTLFYTASVTKAFTVTALAMLADEGKLRIDDPVSKYLPGFAVADADATRLLTIRDLLAHRTGLPRADMLSFSGLSNEEILARMARLAPIAPLRTRFTYQNQMYLALGEIVGRLSGSSWQAFVESRVLSRIGMTDSNAAGLGHVPAGLGAVPHASVQANGRVAPVDYIPRAPYGAGGVNSNARDMARWLQFLMGDGTVGGARLVSAPVLTAMQQPNSISQPNVWTPDSPFLLYGLGWFLSDDRGRKVVQHGGNGEGWTSLVWMLPGEKIGVAVLSNMNNTLLPWAIAHDTADVLTGRSGRDWPSYFLDAERSRDQAQARATPARGTTPLTPADWTGTWSNPVYGAMEIRDDSGLTLSYGPALRAALVPAAASATPSALAIWQRTDLAAVLGPSALKRSKRGTDEILTVSVGGDAIDFVRNQR